MRRFVLLLAALAVAAPSLGHASTTTYAPAWQLGANNKGADSSDQYQLDPNTGSMTVARLGGAVNGSLGCAALGPFAYFQFTTTTTNVVKSVTVHFDNAATDAYTWFHVGVLKDGRYVTSYNPRGPFVGPGDITLDLTPHGNIPGDVVGPVTVEFGINLPSACPSVDVGSATFSSVSVVEA